MQASPPPLQAPAQDPLAGMHDILPPEAVPGPPAWIPWSIAAIVAIVAVTLFLVWLKRRPATPVLPPDPRLVARKALQDLAARLESLAPKDFGIEVSLISRRFIEAVLQIESTRQTSEEFLADPRTRERLPAEARRQLDDFVKQFDTLKYAEGHASTREMRALWDSASNLTSIPSPEPSTPPATPAAPTPPPLPAGKEVRP